MLTTCPECSDRISDKAIICPHCGFPLQENVAKSKAFRKTNKRRRLPNGFGQISEIKNANLRNPFRAMISVGKDAHGRPISELLKPVAYFPTYNDAYAALIEYHKNPYDVSKDITVKELYERWIREYEKTVKNTKYISRAWKYCSAVYDSPVKDIRARHIKGCMEQGTCIIDGKQQTPMAYMKSHIKALFNMLLDYAVEYELVDRNYSKTFKLSDGLCKDITTVKKEHLSFSDEEMELLWKHVDDTDLVDVLLIQCYSGWRPQELGLIELKNVDLESGCITGGIKTEAGKNRTVPIHSKILPLVVQKYHEAERLGSPYLINYTSPQRYNKDTQLTYIRYRDAFNTIRDTLGLDPAHRAHDGRKHFVTMAKKYNVDEYAIKYMVGHKITDITEKIYTHRELAWLKEEIEKIR